MITKNKKTGGYSKKKGIVKNITLKHNMNRKKNIYLRGKSFY